MKKAWTVLIDNREKQPLPIPKFLSVLDRAHLPTLARTSTVRLQTRSLELKTGDYLLEGHESCVIIERKKNLNELCTNCLTLTGRRRFTAELDRLNDECSEPWLFFENVPPTGHAREHDKLQAGRDAMLDLILHHRIRFAMMPSKTLPQRVAAGEWITALLIAGAHHGDEEKARRLLAGTDLNAG